MVRYWIAVLEYEQEQLFIEQHCSDSYIGQTAVRELRVSIARRQLMQEQQRELWTAAKELA